MRYDGEVPTTDGRERAGCGGPARRAQDLVFDFSGKDIPDLQDLTLLLTARMLAEEEDRRVWVRALPEPTWELLQALGLDHMFQLFPAGGGLGH